MVPLKPYSYVILQYVPDMMTDESLNVGIVLHCPAAQFLGILVRPSISRLSQAFPGMNGHGIKRVIGWIRTSIDKHAKHIHGRSGQLFEREPSSALAFAKLHYPEDDSSLRWSTERHGITADPSAELERLFQRTIVYYDRPSERQARSDAEVWYSYAKELDAVGVVENLREHVVAGQIEPYRFEHALKNGRWHCLEPLSFDLLRPESIKSKARDKYAEMSFLAEAQEDLQVYFLLGEPHTDDGKRATDTAIRILQRSPIQSEIVRESEASNLAHRLAQIH